MKNYQRTFFNALFLLVWAACPMANAQPPATLIGTTEMPAGYTLDAREGETSPNGKYAFISAQGEAADKGRAPHYLVSKKPFRILLASAVGRDKHADNERIILWSRESHAALLLAEGDRRVVGATLFDLRAGLKPRGADLMAPLLKALATKFPKGKVTPFGKNQPFVLQEDEDDPHEAWHFTRSERLLVINVFATTQPRMLGEGPVWSGELEGAWSVADGRWATVETYGKIIRREKK